jgi:hypothetical protein
MLQVRRFFSDLIWNHAMLQVRDLFCFLLRFLRAAVALNELRYLGYAKWDTTSLHLLMIRRGRFVSVSRWLITYGGFLVLAAIVMFVVLLAKFA